MEGETKNVNAKAIALAIVQRGDGRTGVRTRGKTTKIIAALANVGLQDVKRPRGDLMGSSVFQKITVIAKPITPGAWASATCATPYRRQAAWATLEDFRQVNQRASEK